MSAGPLLHPESDEAPSHADRDPNVMELFNISPFRKELEILILYLQSYPKLVALIPHHHTVPCSVHTVLRSHLHLHIALSHHLLL
jgi:hypothetical protein